MFFVKNMSFGLLLVELWWDEVKTSSLEKSIIFLVIMQIYMDLQDNGFFKTWFFNFILS